MGQVQRHTPCHHVTVCMHHTHASRLSTLHAPKMLRQLSREDWVWFSSKKFRRPRGGPGSDCMPLPLFLTPQSYNRDQEKAVCSFCTSLVHLACGWGGPQPVLGLCARMCLVCAFDLMSPSVQSWHQKESIGAVYARDSLPKSRKNWSQLSRLVLRSARSQTMTSSTSQQICHCIHIV
jgi:hypothetical protein